MFQLPDGPQPMDLLPYWNTNEEDEKEEEEEEEEISVE